LKATSTIRAIGAVDNSRIVEEPCAVKVCAVARIE
jgi:hypothetical protein